MTFAEPQTLHENTRLANCLQELGLGDHKHTRNNLVERLAELIDLSDAFELSEQLRGLPRIKFTPGEETAITPSGALRAHFIRERRAMMDLLLLKSTPGPNNLALPHEMPDSFDILQRFYTLQQSEMEHQIQKLRVYLREAMSRISLELKQLALLDAALAETITNETRKALHALPRLLQTRFVRLQQEPESYLRFIHDMQLLLLAELDLRLQPLTGLVEALDEHTGI